MTSGPPHTPRLYVLGHPNPPSPPSYDLYSQRHDGSKQHCRTFSDLKQAKARMQECLDDDWFSLCVVEMPADLIIYHLLLGVDEIGINRDNERLNAAAATRPVTGTRLRVSLLAERR